MHIENCGKCIYAVVCKKRDRVEKLENVVCVDLCSAYKEKYMPDHKLKKKECNTCLRKRMCGLNESLEDCKFMIDFSQVNFSEEHKHGHPLFI